MLLIAEKLKEIYENTIEDDFENVTVGLAPHIGVGFPQFKIFYRYNFYLNKDYNCHEIVFFISSRIFR